MIGNMLGSLADSANTGKISKAAYLVNSMAFNQGFQERYILSL